jgi:hypothetical protein
MENEKAIIVGGAIIGITGAAILAKRLVSRRGVDFESMIERMPENAPPKWIFRNVNAIRENTERILNLLESERTSAEG